MKYFKYAFLVLIIIFVTGCSNIKQESLTNILKETNISTNLSNTYRVGYKYYLPSGLKVYKSHDYNELLRDDRYNYYLYVDVVSYYNRVAVNYQLNRNVYYSEVLENGYLEITMLNDDKYLIEIMDNYAKIEVIVDKHDINRSVTYAAIVLSSIEYKYDVLDNMMRENLLNSSEIEFDIFKTINTESNFSIYEAEYGQYDETEIKDTDLIE